MTAGRPITVKRRHVTAKPKAADLRAEELAQVQAERIKLKAEYYERTASKRGIQAPE